MTGAQIYGVYTVQHFVSRSAMLNGKLPET